MSTKSNNEKSQALFERACAAIPGGVNSPVRAFRGVLGSPFFVDRAEGAFLFDVDNNRYIDFVGSWGPLIFGHNAEIVNSAITQAVTSGVSFGAPCKKEVEFAELLTKLIPGLDMVRMVNSGTEATMTAVRLARAYTGREIVLKFDGCYHGHADSLLVAAGSGVATLGIPGSPGIPKEVSELSVSIEFNDLELLSSTIEKIGAKKIACIIIEPVPGNMGLILPEPEYLEGVRELCTKYGIVLIFDEVMSGFRVGLRGAQGRYGVQSDLTTFGKIIGGGLPVGAFGGRREIMSMLAPAGPVYQAGTLSGNPLAMAAGFAVVEELVRGNYYSELEEKAKYFTDGLKTHAENFGIPLTVNYCGSMFGFYFSKNRVINYSEAKKSDVELFRRFFQGMLERGVYLAPSAFEAGFISTAHSRDLLGEAINIAKEVFARLA